MQLGLSASSFIIFNTVGVNSLFNILRSNNESHFVSLYVNPWALNFNSFLVDDDSTEDDWNIGGAWFFVIQTGVGYEYKFGEEKRGGVYIKAGPDYLIGGNVDGYFFGTFGTDVVLLSIKSGFHHMLGNSFSLGIEPSFNYVLNSQDYDNELTVSKFGYAGKIYLSWGF